MTTRPSLPAISAGLLAGFVGFSSSFSVVLQGLSGVGATPAEAASGLMALSIAMGLCGVVVSLWTKMPISIAWSTPGAALLASATIPEGGFPVAVGAFLVSSILIILAGLWRPLGRIIAAIPASLANAMLAGILLALCLAPVHAVVAEPLTAGAVVLTWLAMTRIARRYAVPAAAMVAIAIIAWQAPSLGGFQALPEPVLIKPEWTVAGIIGIALPLFLVTMASQNIPGLAVLKANGYEPKAAPLFTATGVFSVLAVPFGGHAVNLAAITAAICAGPDAGEDPRQRYWAAVVSGLAYVGFGLTAGLVTDFAATDPLLIQTIAGLALIGALAKSLEGAMSVAQDREAAAITFLVTASGIAVAGISAPFWGLLAGAVTLLVTRLKSR